MTRRSPGEGGTYAYTTNQGTHYYWKATVRMPDGRRVVKVKKGFATRRAAQQALRDTLAESQKGEYTEPTQRTVESWLREWMKGPWDSPETAASFEMICTRYLIPFLGHRKLSELTMVQVRQAMATLRTGGGQRGGPLSVRTVQHCRAVLHNALQGAVLEGLIKTNIATADRIKLEKVSREDSIPECWDSPQFEAFLTWAKVNDPTHFALYYIAGTCGIRVSEMCALRWYSITDTFISVRKAKRDKPRTITLSQAQRAVLRDHWQARGAIRLDLARPEAPVFGTVSGEPWTRRAASSAFTRAVRKARREIPDLDPIHFHGLRHTMASILLAAGVPVSIVSERLGHADASITYRAYCHIIPGSQQQAADTMDAMISTRRVPRTGNGAR